MRALSYMLSHGADGMKQASEDAVLNANYIRAGLADLMSLPFGDKPCMHEVLFDDAWLKDTGVTTLDFAKAMIDEGYHPMTMYFPLVVHGAMLIEPTESESKASLDLFIATLRDLAMAAKTRRDGALRRRALPRTAPAPRRDARGPQSGAALDAAGADRGGGGVGNRGCPSPSSASWPGLSRPIDVFGGRAQEGVDPRAKPEDDGGWGCAFKRVMAGLVPAIDVFGGRPRRGVDPRGKPEDDGGGDAHSSASWPGLSGPSTSLAVVPRKGVDPRGKPEDDGGWDAHSSASWPGLSRPSTSWRSCPGKAWILGPSPRMTVDGDAHSSASWPGLSRPSTSLRVALEGVDPRGKPEDDGGGDAAIQARHGRACRRPSTAVDRAAPRKGRGSSGKPEDDGGSDAHAKRVMAGLVRAIHVLAVRPRRGVDPRAKPEDDGGWRMRIQGASWPGMSRPCVLAVRPRRGVDPRAVRMGIPEPTS